MKLKALVIACCAVLLATPTAAQTSGTNPDPISGGWGANGQTLLDLKYDGKAAVSGTVMAGRPGNLAPIETGTFDRSGGVLKLRGEAKDPDTGGALPYVIDGTLTGDALAVSFTFGEHKGNLTLTKVAAAAVSAPKSADAALKKTFGEVSDWVTKAADLVPADKYTYRPASTVRTFGELVGHVADAYNYFCAQAAGRTVQWSDAIEKGATDKATLAPKLQKALDGCNAVYASSGDPGALVENVGHTNLHYGNMVTYIRMLGMVPPSTR
jgi:uncharacterized damage-inducible protein DinB